jgi:tRNA(adenine34) deaminase
MKHDDERWMQIAVNEARLAQRADEVPVGAVLVDATGRLLAAGHNRTVEAVDPTAHAEIVTLRKASLLLGNYRLLNTTLYVTIEPCIMCMGAIIHARVAKVIYGAPDPRWGAAGSLYHFGDDPRLNHRLEILGGVLEDPCKAIMQTFFRSRRKHFPDFEDSNAQTEPTISGY